MQIMRNKKYWHPKFLKRHKLCLCMCWRDNSKKEGFFYFLIFVFTTAFLVGVKFGVYSVYEYYPPFIRYSFWLGKKIKNKKPTKNFLSRFSCVFFFFFFHKPIIHYYFLPTYLYPSPSLLFIQFVSVLFVWWLTHTNATCLQSLICFAFVQR